MAAVQRPSNDHRTSPQIKERRPRKSPFGVVAPLEGETLLALCLPRGHKAGRVPSPRAAARDLELPVAATRRLVDGAEDLCNADQGAERDADVGGVGLDAAFKHPRIHEAAPPHHEIT
jgi:hypothetical protein